MRRALLSAALVLSWSSAAVLAQDSRPAPSPEVAEARAKIRTACAADIQRLCANIERAKGAMRTCLDQNQATLSTECTSARAERAALRSKGPKAD
jgi:hypothetical protein